MVSVGILNMVGNSLGNGAYDSKRTWDASLSLFLGILEVVLEHLFFHSDAFLFSWMTNSLKIFSLKHFLLQYHLKDFNVTLYAVSEHTDMVKC